MRIFDIFKIVLIFILVFALRGTILGVDYQGRYTWGIEGGGDTGYYCVDQYDIYLTVWNNTEAPQLIFWYWYRNNQWQGSNTTIPNGESRRWIGERLAPGANQTNLSRSVPVEIWVGGPRNTPGAILVDSDVVNITWESQGKAHDLSCQGYALRQADVTLYAGDKPPGEINLKINVENIDAPGEVEVEIESSDGGSLTVSATEGNTNYGNQIFTGEDGETATFWGRAIYGNQVVGEFAPVSGTYSSPADEVIFNFSYALTEQEDTEEEGNLGITVVNSSGAPAHYRVVDTATGETLASGSLQTGLNNIDLPLGAVMSGKNIALEASSDGVTWSRLDSKSVPSADVYQDDFGLHIQYPSSQLSGVFGSNPPPKPSPPPQPTPNPAPSPDETITSSETESLATGESALQNVAVSDGGGIELEGGNIPEIPEIEPADDINIDLIFNKANEFLSSSFVPKSLGKVVRLDFGKHEIFDRVMDFSIPIPSWVDFFRRILHIILLYIFAVKTFYLFFRDGL